MKWKESRVFGRVRDILREKGITIKPFHFHHMFTPETYFVSGKSRVVKVNRRLSITVRVPINPVLWHKWEGNIVLYKFWIGREVHSIYRNGDVK